MQGFLTFHSFDDGLLNQQVCYWFVSLFVVFIINRYSNDFKASS